MLRVCVFVLHVLVITGVQSSLIHYWPIYSSSFQDTVSSLSLASSSPSFSKDRFATENSAFRVTDVTSYVYAPSGTLLQASFSVSIWIMIYDNTLSWARVFDFNSGNGDNYVALVYASASTTNYRPRFEFNVSAVKYSAYGPSIIPNIAWTHLVVTADPLTTNLYINGVLVNTTTYSSAQNYAISRTNNYFGRSYLASNPFANCDFDEIKIFNHALSQSEVTAEYTNASNAFKSQTNTNFYNYLIHYWPINGNGVDLVAGADLDSNTPTYTVDRFGNANGAFTVSNATNYFWAPNGNYFSSNGVTVTMWARPRNFGNWQRFFDFGNGENVDCVFFNTFANNGVSFNTVGGVNPANNLTVNSWYHFAITSYQSTTTLYVNGVLLPGAQGTVAITEKKRWINYFGKSNWAADAIGQADFDEIKFFETCLTQQQVIYDYLSTTIPYTAKTVSKPVSPITTPSFYQSMINYWPIENQNYSDYVSGFDLKPSSTPVFVRDRLGNENSAYQTTASNYLDAPPGVYFYNEFTLTAWVNVYDTSSSEVHIIEFGNGAGPSSVVLRFSSYIGFQLYNTGGSSIVSNLWSSSETIQGTKWNHWALSCNLTHARMYFNGGLVASSQLASPVPKILRTKTHIGKTEWTSGVGVLVGELDEIKIFNKSLSASEIYYDYSQKTTEFISSFDSSFYDSYLTHYWPFDQTAGLLDVKTQTNLTTNAATPSYANDRNGNLLSAVRVFDSNTYLQAAAGNYFSTELTITAWLFVNDYANGYHYPRLIDMGNGQEQQNIVIVYCNSNCYPAAGIQLSNSQQVVLAGSYPLTLQKWYHFALSVNSTYAAFYLNGILLNGQSLTSPIVSSSRSFNYFGKSIYPADSSPNIALDEVKFFSKALSHQQVIYDYLRNSTPYTISPSINGTFSLASMTVDQVVSLLKEGYDITDCSGNCSNQGTCFAKGTTLYCLCNSNYTGSTCSQNIDPCFYSPCLNNGTCYSNMTGVNSSSSVSYSCECSFPFSGTNCEIKANVCANTTCSGNGVCVSNQENEPECKCYYLFSGTSCEIASNKKQVVTTVTSVSSGLAISIIALFYVTIALIDLDNLYRHCKKSRQSSHKPIKKSVRYRYTP